MNSQTSANPKPVNPKTPATPGKVAPQFKGTPAPKNEQPKAKPESACTLLGNLGTQPEMRFTPAGKPVTNIRLAVYAGSSVDKSTDERTPETAWFTLTFWGDLAEKANTELAQGMRLKVSGNAPVARQWQGNDQVVHVQQEMTVWEYQIIPNTKQPEAEAPAA